MKTYSKTINKFIFNIETNARAPARAKNKVNWSFPGKHAFSVIYNGDKGMDIFFNFPYIYYALDVKSLGIVFCTIIRRYQCLTRTIAHVRIS